MAALKSFPFGFVDILFIKSLSSLFSRGIFGLWLDGDLDKGSSHMCTTFNNDILTTKEDFHIVNLEVWQLSE